MEDSQEHLKKPAVFFDRDGTLLKFVSSLIREEQLQFVEDAAASIRLINELGFFVFVITNQPVIAKGLVDEQTVHRFHEILTNQLRKEGAIVDAFFLCPHRYPSDCRCRKPLTGMIEVACAQYPIDLKHSFFVGDTFRDVATGIAAGVTTILIKNQDTSVDFDLFPVTPRFEVASLTEAVNVIREIVGG